MVDTNVMLLAGGVAAGAVTQRVTGIGFALVASPLLVLVAGPFQGVVLANVLSMTVSLVVLAMTWRDVEVSRGLMLALPALAMIPLGAIVAKRVPGPVLMVVVGVMVLIALAAVQFTARAVILHGAPGTIAAGAASGFMNVTAGVGGPAIVLYALSTNWNHRKFAATFQLYALIINVASLIAKGGVQLSATTLTTCVVALSTGLYGGHLLASRFNGPQTRRIVTALSALGAAAIVTKGILTW